MINLIMSEFGENRVNAGGGSFDLGRLEPTLTSFGAYFKDIHLTIYTDFALCMKPCYQPLLNLKEVI